jgi:hypothetical protein
VLEGTVWWDKSPGEVPRSLGFEGPNGSWPPAKTGLVRPTNFGIRRDIPVVVSRLPPEEFHDLLKIEAEMLTRDLIDTFLGVKTKPWTPLIDRRRSVEWREKWERRCASHRWYGISKPKQAFLWPAPLLSDWTKEMRPFATVDEWQEDSPFLAMKRNVKTGFRVGTKLCTAVPPPPVLLGEVVPHLDADHNTILYGQ